MAPCKDDSFPLNGIPCNEGKFNEFKDGEEYGDASELDDTNRRLLVVVEKGVLL